MNQSKDIKAIDLLKLISQGEDDIKCGRSKSQEEAFANIEDILKDSLRDRAI